MDEFRINVNQKSHDAAVVKVWLIEVFNNEGVGHHGCTEEPN
jgi:hypothetical protein